MTARVFEIPVRQKEAQSFSVTLSEITYFFTLRWCDPHSSWILDIADANKIPLVQGIPLVTGSDLLGQYAYLGIGGALIVQTDFDADEVPTFDNLGDTAHLYYVMSS